MSAIPTLTSVVWTSCRVCCSWLSGNTKYTWYQLPSGAPNAIAGVPWVPSMGISVVGVEYSWFAGLPSASATCSCWTADRRVDGSVAPALKPVAQNGKPGTVILLAFGPTATL
jgi:hypothetical protein